MLHDLFKLRTPEGAATQIATVLATSVEHHLETLNAMQERASTPKGALREQTVLCDDLVQHCHELGVGTMGLSGQRCWRLATRLHRAAQEQAPKPPKAARECDEPAEFDHAPQP